MQSPGGRLQQTIVDYSQPQNRRSEHPVPALKDVSQLVSCSLCSIRGRLFFENLLPEGKALDDAAAPYAISKNSMAGLLAVLGNETTGVLRILLPRFKPETDTSDAALRPLPREELSERIRERANLTQTIWLMTLTHDRRLLQAGGSVRVRVGNFLSLCQVEASPRPARIDLR